MRTIALLISLLILGATHAGQDDKRYESKAGKYKVMFPGKPEVTSKKLDDGELNMASVPFGGGGFLVIYTDLGEEKVKNSKPKEILTSGEKGLIDNFKAKITSSKDTEFGKQKYPAREILGEAFIEGEAVTVNLRMTLILADQRLYQVFVFGPKDLPKGKEAEKFFESFEIAK